jgi:SOS-response transcriptional repressor LexA
VVLERKPEARDVPLQGFLAPGKPIEPVRAKVSVAVPADMIGDRDVYLLRVRGESLADEQIGDGDYVLVERRTDPENGEVVLGSSMEQTSFCEDSTGTRNGCVSRQKERKHRRPSFRRTAW